MAACRRFADLIDLDTLHLRPGEGRRVDTEVRIEPLMLAGQRYAVDGGTVDTRLDVSRTVTSGYALRLRFDAPIEGACMRCMADAMPVIGVDAREIDQAGDAEELHSPYFEGGVARPRRLGARRARARDARADRLPGGMPGPVPGVRREPERGRPRGAPPRRAHRLRAGPSCVT